MSVEESELMSEVWTRWQGPIVNGVFPLGRYLGCSDHSGVFITKSEAPGSAEVAIKLVPTNRALAELQLPRWKRAGGIAHPCLLRLLQWGGCQLDGLPYLYAVMEYADQTLAQLLLHRALTDEEAREMLPPILEALTFLHGQNLVQGQLKPANILVVGDRLKLASDTIRRVSDGAMPANAPTVYDPPEGRHGSSSPAGDVWALGVSLFEALTRRRPPGSSEPREAVVLPADFSPAFRDVVARCLSLSPQDRPSVPELVAWVRGRSAEPALAVTIEPPVTAEPAAIEPAAIEPAAIEPAAIATPEPGTAEPASASPQAVRPPDTPEATAPAPSIARSLTPRKLLAVVIGALVLLVLGWAAVRMFGSHRTTAPAPVQARGGSPSQAPGGAAPAAAEAQAPVAAVSGTKPGQGEVTTSPSALHEVIPDVPWSARRTIHGHIKVWVRVIVDQDGSVLAAVADKSGPSGYFQRLAIDAAKKWTFPPVDTPPRRLMQIRFDFSRDGTTGRAVALH